MEQPILAIAIGALVLLIIIVFLYLLFWPSFRHSILHILDWFIFWR